MRTAWCSYIVGGLPFDFTLARAQVIRSSVVNSLTETYWLLYNQGSKYRISGSNHIRAFHIEIGGYRGYARIFGVHIGHYI